MSNGANMSISLPGLPTAEQRLLLPPRLNVGCGRDIKPGWTNLDAYPIHGVDVIGDLERCGEQSFPLPADHFEEFLLSHVLEHIRNPLPMMQELHRIAKPGAKMTIRCPYGSSNDAFEDPTHVRQLFENSFGYFSQPFFWRADYGYRGDWAVKRITLFVTEWCRGSYLKDVLDRIRSERNMVEEIVAELEAVKPIREPRRDLQDRYDLVLNRRVPLERGAAS